VDQVHVPFPSNSVFFWVLLDELDVPELAYRVVAIFRLPALLAFFCFWPSFFRKFLSGRMCDFDFLIVLWPCWVLLAPVLT